MAQTLGRTSSLAKLFATEPENDWRALAACKGVDPEIFFSSDDLPDKRERIERESAAKAVCANCAVRTECLAYAIAAGERYGIWGGLNAQERRAAARSVPAEQGEFGRTRFVTLGPETIDLLKATLPKDDGHPPEGDFRPAAVLVPLFVREDEVHVVLTKRTDNVRTHQGQVSFPGGSYEAEDGSLMRTALREAQEEVGLDPDDVQILGVLDDLPTFVSGFMVRPFVASIPHPYDFVHDAAEVDHVFSPPLQLFADPSRRREEMRERDGRVYPLYSYDVGGNVVWGATARMLVQLIEKIVEARA